MSACRIGIALREVSGAIVQGNTLRSNSHEGLWADACSGLTLTDNLFADTPTGMNIGRTSSSWLIGNTLRGHSLSGIGINISAGGLLVAFNTIVTSREALAIATYGVPAAIAGLDIRNNIFAHNTTRAIGISTAEPSSWGEAYNLFFDNAGDGTVGTNAIEGWAPSALAPTDVLASPQFVDLLGGNLTPQAAAFDAGEDSGHDRNGAAPGLFEGLAPDIGAIEVR